MKSKSILLMALLSATVAAVSCNNADPNTGVAGEDGYNETVVKEIKANHPEDFQNEKQIHQVLKGTNRIATQL